MYSLAFLPAINPGEAFVILSIALLFFGAKKLPELARGLGSAVREFSKAKDDIQSEITRPAAVPTPQIETPRDTQPHVAASEQEQTATPVSPAHHA